MGTLPLGPIWVFWPFHHIRGQDRKFPCHSHHFLLIFKQSLGQVSQHVGTSSWPEAEPLPRHWECRVFTTGPPRKSLPWFCFSLTTSPCRVPVLQTIFNPTPDPTSAMGFGSHPLRLGKLGWADTSRASLVSIYTISLEWSFLNTSTHVICQFCKAFFKKEMLYIISTMLLLFSL